MLERLDEVDWTNVGIHVYGSRPQSEIPAAIREVLSENEEIREDALNFLFGQQQDTGDLHDTTPYIIPFILEILDELSAPKNAEILQRLVDISRLNIYTGGTGIVSIHERRTQIRTYDALENGIPVFLKLLKNEVPKVRQLSASLLSNLSDSTTQIVPELVKQFDEETEESEQVTIVESVGHILSATDFRQNELRGYFANWFRNLVENHPTQKVRVSAAKASIGAAVNVLSLGHLTDKDVSQKVADVLSDVYWAALDKKHERAGIVELLTQLQDPEPLLRILENPDTTVDEAQILVRGVLWNIHQYGHNDDSFWDYKKYRGDKKTNIYIDPSPITKIWFEHHHKIFERVLGVDKIWDAPTTLFSFFFRLPDTREELRALIEKMNS